MDRSIGKNEQESTNMGYSATDEWSQQLAHALADANVPTLLMVLVQLTGDRSWLSDAYRPTRGQGLDVNDDGGLPVQTQQEIREAVFDALVAWRRGAPIANESPDDTLLEEMMSTAVGETVPSDQVTMLAEEIGFARRDVDWSGVDPESTRDLDVLVIGAGASGLCAAIKLKEAGVAFEVFEKGVDVGGTWFENTYPGAGVDSPGHLYSFSFDSQRAWDRYYPLRDEVEAYFRSLVPRHGLAPYLRHECEVTHAAYDADQARWRVTIRQADGTVLERSPRILISGVGQLNRPQWPDIDGLADFPGTVAHSAQWPADLDVTGQRVALIGSGASAVQIAPAIAEKVESLTVFQRSTAWTAPNTHYLRAIPDGVRFLVDEVPFYVGWYRFRLLWMFNDRLYQTLQIDPEWTSLDRSINAVNDQHRQYFTRYLERKLEDRPDLIRQLLPDYPPFGKRILMDAGWFDTLKQPQVTLDDTGVARIEGDTVVANSGSRHQVDVIVVATGFHSRRFLWPMQITGRSGKTLRDLWGDDDARAYLGITVPDFPNFFMLYGPNTNLGHGGSIIFHIECQVRYIISLLKEMAEKEIVEVDCQPEVYESYVDSVDAAHDKMIWSHRGMQTWYRNTTGRIVSNSPWRLIDYWRMTREADLGEYLTRPKP